MSKGRNTFFKIALVYLFALTPQGHFARAEDSNPYQASLQAEEAARQAAAERAARAQQAASQNAAALQAQNQNNSSSGTANAIGAAMLASGMAQLPGCCGAVPPACCPSAIMQIIMGLMGLAQGGANKGAAGNAAGNAAQNAASSNPYALTNNKEGSDSSAFAAIEAAKKNGVKYDPKTGKFTLPDGKVMGPSDIGSKDAATAAGVSAGDFDKAMAKIAELEKKNAAAKLAGSGDAGVDSGGGGGSLTPPPADMTEDAALRGALREPTSVAGMAKNFNGDMIGVSGDDIFKMMARRYKQMDSKDSFLPPDAN